MTLPDMYVPAGSSGHGNFTVDIDPQRAGWAFSGLRVLVLEAGASQVVDTGDAELLVLPLAGGATVEVDGHTDNGRSPAFRRELSEKRAQRVVDALVAAGANRDQLVAVGKADTEPAESNSTPEGQAANRRVTFVQRGER